MGTKEDIEKLFDQAVYNLTNPSIIGTFNKGKAFELRVLVDLLRDAKAANYGVNVVPPRGGSPDELRFAGNPAGANRSAFSHFDLTPPGTSSPIPYEAWVSVEFESFSSVLAAQGPSGIASLHELDVAVFSSFLGRHPTYQEVIWASSCKATAFSKAQLREALGFRRELGVLAAPIPASLAGMHSDVPCDPPSVFMLSSIDAASVAYSGPVSALGVDIQYLRFQYT